MPAENSVSVLAGSTAVLGHLTQFVAYPGDTFNCAGLSVPVMARVSTSELTLAYPWPGDDVEETVAWSLQRTAAEWSSAVQIHKSVAALVQRFEGGLPVTPGHAAGNSAGRALYDDAPAGFIYVEGSSVPGSDLFASVKLSDDNGDWSAKQLMKPDRAQSTVESEAARDLAQAWAIKTDAAVDDDEYSAKHHALAAAADRQQTGQDRAATTADKAQTGLDRAATAADRLQTGLDRAASQIAVETSWANAKTYASVALGLAATADGEQFIVPDGDRNVRYRRDSASVAVELTDYPTAAKVEAIQNNITDQYAFALVDGAGAVALGVKPDGSVEVGKLNGETDVAGGLQGGANIRQQSVDGFAWTILDQNGVAAAGVKDDGTFAAAAMQAQYLNGVSVAEIISGTGSSTAAIKARVWPAEYNMVLSYGQSLSVGADAVPPITTTQRFDNLTFVGGVRSQDSGTPYTSLVPLTETQVSNAGETPIGGATDMIKERILAEDQLAYTDHSFQLIGSAPGAGGTAIAGLSIGTTPYNRFKADVQAGYTLAQAAGKSFSCNAFFWTQAESDYIGNTSAATYKAAYIKLRDDLENDVQAITGRPDPLHCISYQVNGHATYGYAGNPYLAVAQWEVARDNDYFHVACPLYWSPQTVHQTATNSKILGAYYGLCYKRVVINGDDWKPLSPLSVNRQGNIIFLSLHVPVGVLTFDNVLIPLRTNYGFSVVDSSGDAVTINSVAITGPNTVKIVTASAASGGRLRYGYTNGGNLRDQQGDTIIFDGGGINHPMHNWCVIFNEALN